MINEEAIEVLKNDCFVYYNCVSGNCPRIIEEKLYGVTTSTCDDYGCNTFGGCFLCYYEGSDYCKECIHIEEAEE